MVAINDVPPELTTQNVFPKATPSLKKLHLKYLEMIVKHHLHT